jgi:hypothetical protein
VCCCRCAGIRSTSPAGSHDPGTPAGRSCRTSASATPKVRSSAGASLAHLRRWKRLDGDQRCWSATSPTRGTQARARYEDPHGAWRKISHSRRSCKASPATRCATRARHGWPRPACRSGRPPASSGRPSRRWRRVYAHHSPEQPGAGPRISSTCAVAQLYVTGFVQ